MRLEFHPEALAEYEDAARYYSECQPGLETRFINAIEYAIQQILDAPQAWRILEEDVRWHLTRVFPYAVLYTIERDYVLIIALMHCHRKPGYWRERVSGGIDS
jgi:toxin ParE1/3/4